MQLFTLPSFPFLLPAAVEKCLGRLALLNSALVLPYLQCRLAVNSAGVRASMVRAVHYAILEEPHPVDAMLIGEVADFLAPIGDEDRCVRGRGGGECVRGRGGGEWAGG